MNNDKETMIVASQEETHVYAGDTGYVVIKQKKEMENDAVIFIDPQNVKAIIDALQAALPKAIQFRTEWLQEDAE